MQSNSPVSTMFRPKTPPKADEESIRKTDKSYSQHGSMQEVHSTSQRNTLSLDTQMAVTSRPGSRRVSPSGTIEASPTSSSHSRPESSASYTPLRSARGSLSLGGTAHHSVLSRRSSLSQSGVSREALALPLANTDTLILVPDAVASRSPLCSQTTAEYPEMTEAQSQRQQEPGLTRRRRHRQPSRRCELRNTAIYLGALCILFVTALSIYTAIAIPRVGDIPTSIHIFVIGTFVIILALIVDLSRRFQKALKRHKTTKSFNPGIRCRDVEPNETEESLLPHSPIMVQYEADDDIERPGKLPSNVRSPPPVYGRRRGSYRLDPDLLHWRRVGNGEEGEMRSSVDTAPPMYASPARPRESEADRRQVEVMGPTEMAEVGRAR